MKPDIPLPPPPMRFFEDFFDSGNHFTYGGRFFELKVPNDQRFEHYSKNLAYDISIDGFMGLIGGNFPYSNGLADVNNFKIQSSANLTFTFKMELMQFLKYDVEVNLLPMLAGLGFETFMSTSTGLCFNLYSEIELLRFDTLFGKNMKQCSFNVLRLIDSATNAKNLLNPSFYSLHTLKQMFDCDFEEYSTFNNRHLNFLSGSLIEFISPKTAEMLNQKKSILQFCLGGKKD